MKSVVHFFCKFQIFFVLLLGGCTFAGLMLFGQDSAYAQQPTGTIPTVTSTPLGAYIVVNADQDQINVRAGPGPFYSKIGVLLAGQRVAAKGRSVGGEWIQVDYPGVPGGVGWVYAALVTASGSNLPVVEPPPTPTPLFTATIDPTLAAQFVITFEPSKLPTFTAPPPLAIPTFTTGQPSAVARLPMGLVISAIGILGIFLGALSLLRSR